MPAESRKTSVYNVTRKASCVVQKFEEFQQNKRVSLIGTGTGTGIEDQGFQANHGFPGGPCLNPIRLQPKAIQISFLPKSTKKEFSLTSIPSIATLSHILKFPILPAISITENSDSNPSLPPSFERIPSILSSLKDKSFSSEEEEPKKDANTPSSEASGSTVNQAYIFASAVSQSYKKAIARSARLARQESLPVRLKQFLKYGTLRSMTSSNQRGDTHSFSPREKWRFAIDTVCKLVKSFGHCSSIYKGADSQQDADTIFNLYKFHQEVALSSKISRYFSKPTLNEIERSRLNHLLSERITLFTKQTYEQKVRLCLYVKYERQGGEAQFVYVVLSGQIQIDSKSAENELIRVQYYNMGSSLNTGTTDGSYHTQSIRDSTAVLNADSEFLCFDRKDYWNIMKGSDTDMDVARRLNVLRSINTFAEEEETMLEQAAQRTMIRYFPKGAAILQQGQSNKHLFWILAGNVRIDRTVNFVRRTRRGRMRPDTCNAHIMHGELRVPKVLTVGNLGRNACFPEAMLESITLLKGEFDRLDLTSKLTDHDALGRNKTTVSVTASTPVVCLSMLRIDFCKIMTTEMWTALQRESYLYAIKPKPLQVAWLDRLDWERQKKIVLHDVMKHKEDTKDLSRMALQKWSNSQYC